MSPFFYHGFYNSEGDDYNGRHFWSNFEIADMEFYRSDLYERYMDALDETKGVTSCLFMTVKSRIPFLWQVA